MTEPIAHPLRSRSLQLPDVRLHVVEAGTGPLVLLVHGFPESWYSWRHQLPALAAAGYHAVAVDVRGYGRSSKPAAIDAYRMMALVADNVELVAALGHDQAVIVGHDWGAPIAWNSALLRPDVFRAVAGLSVPYTPRGRTRPSDAFRVMGGEEEFYIGYFQEPGRAEAEIEADVAGWLAGFYLSASGAAPPMVPGNGTMATIPAGGRMRDRFHQPDTSSGNGSGGVAEFMTAEDLAYFVAEFERSGLTGGLNRYRNVDRDFEDLAAFTGRPIEVPALFIGGSKDGPTLWGGRAIARFGETLPNLHRSLILPDCGHWTQQERPAEVNAALIEFLSSLPK
ncbi:MAG: alpha/beta fold hydrolase [Acidimicrobiales bacterium]